MAISRAKVVFLLFSLASAVMMITLLIIFRQPAFSPCDCGYVVNIDNATFTFTDALETDFVHLSDISQNTDWVRQEFNRTKESARGLLGETFTIQNIYTSANLANDLGRNHHAGLELAVKAVLVDDMVSAAEVDTARTDMFYGSYRAGIKLSGVPGTCAAFFWYFSDTSEIDVEFLSQDFNATNSSYPINLILHDSTSDTHPKFAREYLPFDPTADFHEYRFDFISNTVFFYADNQFLSRLDGRDLPARPGHLALQHWSNGNPLWSGGPPCTRCIHDSGICKGIFQFIIFYRDKQIRGLLPESSNTRETLLGSRIHDWQSDSYGHVRQAAEQCSQHPHSSSTPLVDTLSTPVHLRSSLRFLLKSTIAHS
ncbi:concanavalin A-like lectin/glucanase domain-containing protein [Apodospora peruviana]|uniref:Concanavalin A-like lectin/glucanase domain-containing protein n=1 Tax=Apodospora peruviana TaxID=516989 RepID=A0AAE0M0H5_9PEZI|nr:concanavalin A-like lectin/glucanase domain-containing protein [Apodospora peruviana]